jgi:hypothetical protein
MGPKGYTSSYSGGINLRRYFYSIHLFKEIMKANFEAAEMTTCDRKLNSFVNFSSPAQNMRPIHSVGLLLRKYRNIDPVLGAYSSVGRRAKRRQEAIDPIGKLLDHSPRSPFL